MKPHYDFSKGERGKFFQPGAIFRLPVYLDAKVEHYLAKKAEARGIDLSDLVNEILKKSIGLAEAEK